MTFTIPLSLMGIAAFSAFLFIAVTIICWRNGMFDGGGGYAGGLDALFTIIAYAILWAIPSLAAWAVYATWFGGAT